MKKRCEKDALKNKTYILHKRSRDKIGHTLDIVNAQSKPNIYRKLIAIYTVYNVYNSTCALHPALQNYVQRCVYMELAVIVYTTVLGWLAPNNGRCYIPTASST